VRVSEAAVRAYATTKRFAAATLERWLRCTPADQTELLRLIESMRLGENHTRDLLDAMEAIALRQQTTFASILHSETVSAVLNAGRARNETLHLLKQALRRLRYPQLAAAETHLRELTKRLGLPAGVTLTLPENLEGDELVFSVRARSAAELRRRMEGASAAVRATELDQIYRILGGEW
jgi:hypothetical protein